MSKKNTIAIIILVFLNIVFFFPLIFQGKILLEGNLLFSYVPWLTSGEVSQIRPYNCFASDGLFYFYPFYKFAVESVRQGILPLWDPLVGCGIPFYENASFPFFYPGIALFYVLPFDLAWNLTFILHFILSGLCMYLFLKKLGLSSYASLFGSIAYNFGGFAFTFLFINEHIYPFFWTPLIFLVVEIFVEKPKIRTAALLGLIVGLQCLIGQVVFTFYLLFVAGSYFLFRLICRMIQEKNGKIVIRYFLLICVSLFIFLLIASPVIFSYAKLMSVTTRGENTVLFSGLPALKEILRHFNPLRIFSGNGAGHPWYLSLSVFSPYLFGDCVHQLYWGSYNYAYDITSASPRYWGVFTLIFFLFMLFHIKRGQKKAVFFVIASLILFAANFKLLNILVFLPVAAFLEKYHNRMLFILAFTVPVAASFGFDSLLAAKRPRQAKISITGIVLKLGLIIAACYLYFFKSREVIEWAKNWIVRNNIQSLMPNIEYFIKYEFIVLIIALSLFVLCLGAYLLFVKKKINPGIFAAFVILITSVELVAYGSYFYPRVNQSDIYPLTASLRYLKKNSADHRIVNMGSKTGAEVMWPNSAHIYGLKSVNYYSAFVCERFYELLKGLRKGVSNKDKFDYGYVHGVNLVDSMPQFFSPLMDLMGAKYLCSGNRVRDEKTVHIDFIEQLGKSEISAPGGNYVFGGVRSTGSEPRRVLFQHSESKIITPLFKVPEDGALKFGTGFDDQAFRLGGEGRDGVNAVIRLKTYDDDSERVIYSGDIDPFSDKSDREWNDVRIDMSEYAGKQVSLIFEVAPKEDTRGDNFLWGNPRITVGGDVKENAAQSPVFTKEMIIYENKNVLPMAYLAGSVITHSGFEEALGIMEEEGYDPGKSVLVDLESDYEPMPDLSGLTNSFIKDVKIAYYGVNRVEIETDCEKPSILVFSDNYFKGWKVSVDGGMEKDCLIVNGAFRGVRLEPGQHSILFVYRPRLFIPGILCMIVGSLLSVILMIRIKK